MNQGKARGILNKQITAGRQLVDDVAVGSHTRANGVLWGVAAGLGALRFAYDALPSGFVLSATGILVAFALTLWWLTTCRFVVGLTASTVEIVKLDRRGQARERWSWPRDQVQARTRGGWFTDVRVEITGPSAILTMCVKKEWGGNCQVMSRLAGAISARWAA